MIYSRREISQAILLCYVPSTVDFLLFFIISDVLLSKYVVCCEIKKLMKARVNEIGFQEARILVMISS